MTDTTQTDGPTLQDRLRTQLVMSMFLNQKHLYQEEERQRNQAADALDERDATIAALVEALDPFSEMAGELFANNYNAHISVCQIGEFGASKQVTAGQFFAARAALARATKQPLT